MPFTNNLAQEYAEIHGETSFTSTSTRELSQAEIREMLHPGYPVHKIPRNRIIRTSSETRLKPSKPSIKVQVQQTPYSRYKKDFSRNMFDTFSRSRTTKFPNLGLTVANDGAPYTDPASKVRQAERESKLKWVSNRNFESVFSPKRRPKESSEGLLLGKSAAAGNHIFREEHKERWIAGAFKIAKY
jgi:hypothetical protein